MCAHTDAIHTVRTSRHHRGVFVPRRHVLGAHGDVTAFIADPGFDSTILTGISLLSLMVNARASTCSMHMRACACMCTSRTHIHVHSACEAVAFTIRRELCACMQYATTLSVNTRASVVHACVHACHCVCMYMSIHAYRHAYARMPMEAERHERLSPTQRPAS